MEGMAKRKSYKLLCPISRALDVLGDRWTLLILRDLHAGPARFGDLHGGLPGLATNLFSTRLQALQEDGLIYKIPNSRPGLYALSELGERSASVLFELATFGVAIPRPPEVRRPGNLRTVAVTLKEALRRVMHRREEVMTLELQVDEERFDIRLSPGKCSVKYASSSTAPLSVRIGYEALIDVADGRISPEVFSQGITVVRGTPQDARVFLGLLDLAFMPS